MTHLIRFVLILLAVCAVAGIYSSCAEDSDCSLEGRRMLYCTFSTLNPDNKTVLKDTLDSLTVTAFGTDSIIVNNQKKVTKLSLPLRYTNDTTVFVLRYDYARRPKYADTLYVIHNNVPFFESVECGYTMQQTILKSNSTKYELDSMHISNYELQSYEDKNIELFFHYHN